MCSRLGRRRLDQDDSAQFGRLKVEFVATLHQQACSSVDDERASLVGLVGSVGRKLTNNVSWPVERLSFELEAQAIHLQKAHSKSR